MNKSAPTHPCSEKRLHHRRQQGHTASPSTRMGLSRIAGSESQSRQPAHWEGLCIPPLEKENQTV